LSLWVLDTDTLTLWLLGQEIIAARIAATPPQQLAVTIITVEEMLGGWYTQIRPARDDQQLARAYQALHQPLNSPGAFRSCRSISQGFASIVN
jgi:tRNA(fMet)-specific endonuclease VapC